MLDEFSPARLLGGHIDPRLISNIEFLLVFFLMMLVMNALELSGLLSSLGQGLARRAKSEKRLALLLCLFVFFAAALLTNDIVLLGVVPLTIVIGVSSRVDVVKIVIFEGIAANAGSTLTPFGNPQNIYIAVNYHVSFTDFAAVMAPLWLVSLCLLVAFVTLLFSDRPLHRIHRKEPHWATAALGLSSLFMIMLYFLHALPVTIIALVVLLLIAATMKAGRIFRKFDWKLFLLFAAIALATYVVFLVFTAGLSGAPLFFGAVGLSQAASNVPATFILSGTSHWQLLALGVNIGGSGTLISSIATLIAYRYAKKYDAKTKAADFMKWGALFCLLQVLIMLPLVYFYYF